MITDNKLDFWLDARLNVLFEGKHGVGKSAIIIETFKRNKLRYAYFSGATMDPYVDFVGIPVKIDRADGKGQVLQFIKPEYLVNLDVQAIFMDELNRSHKKVRNAVMELVQFKTVNGQPFSKDLRVVWAAINPDSDDSEEEVYDTDRLDPAQRDRFQIQVEIPYACDIKYFSKKFGADVAKPAVAWWNTLPAKIQDLISPRRLDYALDLWLINGDLSDCLPKSSNPSSLIFCLKNGNVEEKIKLWYTTKNIEGARDFLDNSNNLNQVEKLLVKPKYIDFYLPLLSKEKQSQLYAGNATARGHMLEKFVEDDDFVDVLTSLQDSKLLKLADRKKIKSAVQAKARNAVIGKALSGQLCNPNYGDVARQIVSLWQEVVGVGNTVRSVNKIPHENYMAWWDAFSEFSECHSRAELKSNFDVDNIMAALVRRAKEERSVYPVTTKQKATARKFGYTIPNW